MSLREQILKLGERRINPEYVRSAGFINTLHHLAQLAFVDEWEEGIETRAGTHAFCCAPRQWCLKTNPL